MTAAAAIAAVPEPLVVSKHDEELADLLERVIGADIRYDRSAKRWLSWQKTRWLDDEAPVHRMIADQAADWINGTRNGEKIKAFLTLYDVQKQKSVMEALSHRPGIRMNGDEFDQAPELLGVKNGVVDLRTGQWSVEGNKTDYVTRQAKIAYDPEAGPSKVFWQFLLDIMSGDEKMADYLLGVLGYSLFGFQREQKFWLFVGGGQNGKGTLTKIVHWLLGEYAIFAQATLYMKSRYGEARANEARSDLIQLQGIRFAPTSEPVGGAFNDELVKHHTGDDPIRARQLYSSRQIEFRPTHTLIFLTNDPPKVDDVGMSMRRRVRVVYFNENFIGPREDKDLEAKLRDEAPRILWMLVWAAKRYAERGLPEPEQVTSASGAYVDDQDPITRFLIECCVLGRRETTMAKPLYDTYVEWAGEKAKSSTGFALALARVPGIDKTHTVNGNQYIGVRPKHAGEIADEGSDDDGPDE